MRKKFKGYPPPGVPPFAQVPLMLLRQHSHDLTPVQINVLNIIMGYTYAWHKTTGVISVNQLAADVNLNRKTVTRAVRALEEYGVITVKRETSSAGEHQTNVFIITVDDTALGTSSEQQQQVADAVRDLFDEEG